MHTEKVDLNEWNEKKNQRMNDQTSIRKGTEELNENRDLSALKTWSLQQYPNI